ncbi:hypothetical protein TNCV_250651 [Trichonephila clavipes]|nr:hypothetical protein TNCV_250651 [Trichonephila clavipes]
MQDSLPGNKSELFDRNIKWIGNNWNALTALSRSRQAAVVKSYGTQDGSLAVTNRQENNFKELLLPAEIA